MPSKISYNDGVKEEEKTTPSLPLFQRPVWVACFALTAAVVWGWAYPLIKLGFEEFGITQAMTASKMLFAGVRFMLAGFIVLAIAAATGRRFTVATGGGWLYVLLYARSVPFPLFALVLRIHLVIQAPPQNLFLFLKRPRLKSF